LEETLYRELFDRLLIDVLVSVLSSDTLCTIPLRAATGNVTVRLFWEDKLLLGTLAWSYEACCFIHFWI